jgi:two-component system, NarL family, sensor histidine kinase UhpB
MSMSVVERADLAQAQPRGGTFGARATWHRFSLRAKLLLVFVLVDLVAAFVIGSVTIIRARVSTRVEIAASMALAETLVAEAIGGSNPQAVRSLAEHASRQRLMRHVRLSVRNAAHLPVMIAPQRENSDAARSPAPVWFEALIAPPIERRELPIVSGGQALGSVLITGVAEDEIAEAWENFVALTLVGAGLNLAVIMLLYVLFGRVLEPLTSLATGLRDLESRNYGVRLARPDGRELGAIAERFNSLAQALDALRAENSQLHRRLITAQDDERRFTALELHDEVGPSLFGLKANAASIVAHAPSSDLAERAREMLAIIDHLQATNRNLLNRLRPMALGDVPLTELLSELARERTPQPTGIHIAFVPGPAEASYGEPVDLTMYRCAQEALTNAIRHADATRIDITFYEAEGILNLRVEDDGRGIGTTRKGRGLTGMQERVHGLGGRCVVEDAPNGGTRLSIGVPIRTPVRSVA